LSVEDQISRVEKYFLNVYQKIVHLADGYTHTFEETNDAIKSLLSLQRQIELLLEDVKELSDEKTGPYIDRCVEAVEAIRILSRGGSRIKGVCNLINEGEYGYAYRSFKRIRTKIYELLEDIRLIYSLRIYPIEEKIALKSRLSDLGFTEAVRCLDEAESNLATKHYKDCINRCREALEKTVTSILLAQEKKPSGYFATDMGTLSNMIGISKEHKKLIEATYSYLSEVGAHGRGEKPKMGDAYYAMKETYMRIGILMKKYEDYSKKKSK